MFRDFCFVKVEITRERVCHVVLLSREPLGVFFDVVVGEVAGVFLAISRQTVTSVGSIDLIEMFVFFIQPAEVVLSVIDRAQLPGLNRLLIRSIHGVTIEAMNSSRLFMA